MAFSNIYKNRPITETVATVTNGLCKGRIGNVSFDLTDSGETCSDTGKVTIVNQVLCRDAANTLGKIFAREDIWDQFPTGCFLYDNKVHWNTHETGERSVFTKAVCVEIIDCADQRSSEWCNELKDEGYCEFEYYGSLCPSTCEKCGNGLLTTEPTK